jgi:hypothetical protein
LVFSLLLLPLLLLLLFLLRFFVSFFSLYNCSCLLRFPSGKSSTTSCFFMD